MSTDYKNGEWGYVPVQAALGTYHITGFGVEKDYTQGYKLLGLVAKAGSSNAKNGV